MVAGTSFSDRGIPKLPAPAAGQIDYFDDSLPGFGLRVSHGGTRTWIVLYRYNGKKRRMKIGRYPQLGLAAARDEAMDILEAARKGKDPATEKKEKAKPAETVSDLVDRYIKEYAKIEKRSWFHDDRILHKEVVPLFGRKRLTDVTRRDIRGALKPIVERGSGVRANRALEIIRKMFNWAIQEDLLTVNPAAGMAKLATESHRERYLSPEEYKKLWEALPKAGIGEHGGEYFKLIILTGLREMEVLKAEWAQIDFNQKIWTIPSKNAKNSRDQLVPISPMVLEALLTLKRLPPRERKYVFQSPEKDTHVVRNFVEKRIVKLRKVAKIKDLRIHDLRRSATTYWGKLKVEPHIKDRLLNHAAKKVSDKHYDQWQYLDEKRAALESWEQLVVEMIGTKSTPPSDNVVPMRAGG